MKPRILATALVLLLVGLLVYVRVGTDPATVSVPAGARAGDLVLEPCTVEHQKADCGTLVVPENRLNPESRLIALPVTRLRSTSPQKTEDAPIFYLNGGPGLTNMTFPEARRFTGSRDVVMVGYRGVDGSSRLDCPEVVAALRHTRDFLDPHFFQVDGQAFRSCARRLTAHGVDLSGYSMAEQTDDLEAARQALGYPRVDLLSESAGTRVAMIYAWRHPAGVHRSVMIGVNPPGHFVWAPKTTDAQLQQYSALCAADATCRARTGDLAQTLRDTAAHLPARWLGLRIKPGNVRVAAFFGLVEQTSAAGLNGPLTLDAWLAAAHGDPSGLWFMSLAADLIFPTSFVWGEYASVGQADAAAGREHFASGTAGEGATFGDSGNEFTWSGGALVGAWPEPAEDRAYATVRPSNVETLLIGGSLDFTTPPINATNELLPELPNGHQVVLDNLGHVADFYGYEPAAGTRLITTFLHDGRVDRSLYTPATVDFTPQTPAPYLAKLIVGVMIGLALVTVIGLLGFGVRVRRRRLGRAGRVLLRSVTPVLGVGGWCLGALIVLSALPGLSGTADVPVDDEVLCAFAIGLPVGLGTWLAWVRPGAPAVSAALATAGGVAGSWLGYHATSGVAALLTAVVGAVAGANVAVLALDWAPARTP
jgi:pimeloyl-ACP methyl ester carboxylesterase